MDNIANIGLSTEPTATKTNSGLTSSNGPRVPSKGQLGLQHLSSGFVLCNQTSNENGLSLGPLTQNSIMKTQNKKAILKQFEAEKGLENGRHLAKNYSGQQNCWSKGPISFRQVTADGPVISQPAGVVNDGKHPLAG